jgi:hypothetical protein
MQESGQSKEESFQPLLLHMFCLFSLFSTPLEYIAMVDGVPQVS